MKRGMLAVMAGTALLMAGCATKSGYVGQWKSVNIPEEINSEGMEALSMTILEQGGVTIIGETDEGQVVQGASGSWKANELGGITFVFDENEDATGLLLGDGTLVMSADGQAVRFSRQK